MIDLSVQRSRFRNGILAAAEARMNAKLGSIQMPARVMDIPIVLGAQGVALVTTTHIFFRLGLNGQVTILTWSLAATVAGAAHIGAVTLDVLVGSTLATVASICGTRKPALAAVSELPDQTPDPSWTVTIADPQWILVKPTTVDGVLEVVGLTLRVAVDQR